MIQLYDLTHTVASSHSFLGWLGRSVMAGSGVSRPYSRLFSHPVHKKRLSDLECPHSHRDSWMTLWRGWLLLHMAFSFPGWDSFPGNPGVSNRARGHPIAQVLFKSQLELPLLVGQSKSHSQPKLRNGETDFNSWRECCNFWPLMQSID